MPAGMYGADPEQLSALGSKLVAQNEPIAQIQTVVFTTLAGTTWQGPPATSSRRSGTTSSTRPSTPSRTPSPPPATSAPSGPRRSLEVMGVVA